MTALLLFRKPSADTLLGRALNGLLKSPKATIAAIVCLLLLRRGRHRTVARAAEPLRPDADQHHGCQAPPRLGEHGGRRPTGSARMGRDATCCRP